MARFKLTIEYDGAPFFGWQRLAEGPSVQAALEEAVFNLSGERATVTGAGRTDSGVHALGQVAHVDLAMAIAPERLSDALNAHVRPHPIAVLSAQATHDAFHARFDAVRRTYEYRIVNRRADLALARGRAWRVSSQLDAARMHAAAQALLGRHDFTTFRDSHCQAESPVKTLEQCDVACADEEVVITCAARSFLHRQVRSMVGSLVEVGVGKWSPQDLVDALAAADRARCGPVAPACGLYLMCVDY